MPCRGGRSIGFPALDPRPDIASHAGIGTDGGDRALKILWQARADPVVGGGVIRRGTVGVKDIERSDRGDGVIVELPSITTGLGVPGFPNIALHKSPRPPCLQRPIRSQQYMFR